MIYSGNKEDGTVTINIKDAKEGYNARIKASLPQEDAE